MFRKLPRIIFNNSSPLIRAAVGATIGLTVGLIVWQFELGSINAFFFDMRMRLTPELPVDNRIITVDFSQDPKADPQLRDAQYKGRNPKDYLQLLDHVYRAEPYIVILADDPLSWLSHPEELSQLVSYVNTKKNFYLHLLSVEMFVENQVKNHADLKKLNLVSLVAWDYLTGGADRVARRWLLSFHQTTSPQDYYGDILFKYEPFHKITKYIWMRSNASCVHAYYRRPNSYPVVIGNNILSGQIDNSIFKDKVVVIGVDGNIDSDNFRKTPVEYNSLRNPMRELVANATDGLLTQRFPKDLPYPKITSFLGILAFSVLLCLFSPLASLGVSILFALTYAGVAVLLYWFDLYLIEMAHTFLSMAIIQYILLPIGFIFKAKDDQTRFSQLQLERERSVNRARIAAKTARADIGLKTALQVAHDIRSPLSAISTVESLGRDLLKPEMSDLLKKSVERLNKIANDLITKFREGDPAFRQKDTSFDLITTIQSLIESYQITWPKIQFEFFTALNHITTSINRTNFERALSNLINNAIEAQNAQGKISITVQKNEGNVLIEIADSGPGVPEQLKSNLFQKGETFGKKGGTGLGLHQAKETFLAFKGDLELKKSDSNGTTFLAKIPAQLSSELFLQIKNNLIIVDDSPEILALLQTTFGEGKRKIIVFKNPAVAIRHLKENRSGLNETTLVTDLIFEDFDETGFDVIQTYHELQPNVVLAAKPILCTTLGDSIEIQNLAGQYHARVLSKANLDIVRVES